MVRKNHRSLPSKAGAPPCLELGCWLFDDWLAELPLAETLEENGVDLIAVYLLTPDAYSLPRLPYVLDLIKPPRTLIVLNEWGFEADKACVAFAPILANPIVGAAQADGAADRHDAPS